MVSQDHQLPALVPLRLVASAGKELVTHLAAGADPVRPGEAGGAHHELSRILHQLDPVGIAVPVVFEAAALEALGGRANCRGGMLASNLTLNPDEFVTPRDWGEGVSAVGGPLRMKVAVRNAGTASVAGFHRLGGGCSGNGGGRSTAGVLDTSPITRLASLRAASTEAAVVAGRGALPLLSFLLVSIVVHSAVTK